MGLFGKSFEEKVDEAIEAIRSQGLAVRNLKASTDGEVVTLSGEVDEVSVKGQVMAAFGEMVETENTLNRITVARPAPAPAATTAATAPADAATVAIPSDKAAAATEAQLEGPPVPVEDAAAAAGGERIHEVMSGDTLGALAKTYYGAASKYMTIFEANRDQLDDPNLIKVGQKLRIPALSEPGQV